MKKIDFLFIGTIGVFGLTCNSSSVTKAIVNHKDASKKMQDFVINISKYTRKSNPNFIIIPQNGEELAYTNADISKPINENYLKAIDGFGIEELHYNKIYKPNNYRIGILQKLKAQKPVFVSEFVNDTTLVKDAQKINNQEGFVNFIRTKDNYHYAVIPEKINNENSSDVTSLKDAKNFLYLINNSNYYSKSKFLEAISNTNYDLVLIDLYHNGVLFKKEEIEKLKLKKNGGKRLVVCYMNIGAAEKYRNYWKREWSLGNPSWLKKNYDGYDNEIWVEYWNKEWQKIIYGNDNSYSKKVVDAGFDGVYLDNVEAYYFLYND
jgi:cysteinyl-tRNA synthetase